MLQCAAEGGNELATDFREEPDAPPKGRFSEAFQCAFWRQQEQFWVEMAAQFGVREAEWAAGVKNPDG
ncbi:MAG: hypothetical protein P8Y52_05015 [Xanthomonadales bacterium]